ncbi:hypothetical protein [Rhizobium sp. RAF56]|uniref:hypothetical protein n=1 Tax=Rhizobium sp. RAF56 TaxID=3233062 RepID=UPI003F95DE1A
MPKDREAFARLRPAGDWRPKLAIDNTHDDLYFRLRRDVACSARAAQEANEAIAALLEIAPATMLARKQEFMTLARAFAEVFKQVTEAVDVCIEATVPWRDLLTEYPGILAALDAGIAEEQRVILARAYARFLREGGPSPLS